MDKIKINLDNTQKGIWKYWESFPFVDQKNRLSLGEGETAQTIFDSIIFKREDQNPTGSLKDRGMAYLLSQIISQGVNKIVIPSSGNAGISACSFGKLMNNINIIVYGSIGTNKEKAEKIRSLGFEIKETEKPIYNSEKFAIENNYYFLRPSLEKYASEGYKTIAYELDNENGKIDDIFIPVSSGVCFLGIFSGFEDLGYFPRMHLCQSSLVNPIAGIYDRDFIQTETSLADGLVSKKAPLKEKIINAIDLSKGTGWVIEDDSIIDADKILENNNIITSPEGSLVYAATIKAIKKGWKLGKTVCLLTGKKYV